MKVAKNRPADESQAAGFANNNEKFAYTQLYTFYEDLNDYHLAHLEHKRRTKEIENRLLTEEVNKEWEVLKQYKFHVSRRRLPYYRRCYQDYRQSAMARIG